MSGPLLSLIDPLEFATAYDNARSEALDFRRHQTDLDHGRDPSRHSARQQRHRQLAAIERMAKLWSPFGKQLQIFAIKDGDNLILGESARMDALGQFWSDTFCQPAPIDSLLAGQFAEKFATQFDFTHFEPPSSSYIHYYLRQVRNSSPGVDGIPFRAWLRSGPTAWRLLHHVAVWLCQGLGMLSNFNDTLMIFIAKGQEADDDSGVVRSSGATRPLGLKNADVKCISGATYHMLRSSLATSASPLQNGFLFRRNFLNNIVDLDTHARVYSMQPSLPVLLFTDFGAAFPSLIQQWLFLVLQRSGFPSGLISFLEGIHNLVSAVGRAGSASKFLFFIMRGVIQGCPLASFCFVIAFDPFLNMFYRNVVAQKVGIVRACADDVGFALSTIDVLKAVASTLESAESLAGLKIKMSKCTIVPLERWSDALEASVKTWLRANLPDWLGMCVAPASKYLGTFLGTVVGNSVWHLPIAKWSARVSAIASSRAPPTIAAHLYNKFAAPVLSYVSQLSFPPKELLTKEAHALSRILHVPPNSFSLSDLMSLRHWGSVHFQSLFVSCVASLLRAALLTITTSEHSYETLHAAAVDNLPFARVLSGHLWPSHWDSPALACVLRDARLGFPSRPNLREFTPGIVERARLLISSDVGEEPLKIQRMLSDELRSKIFPDSIPSLLRRRLPLYCAGFDISLLNIDQLRSFLESLSPAWAHSVLKTWANAWTTSTRMHEATRRECLFGCADASDALSHYVVCPSLWASSGSDFHLSQCVCSTAAFPGPMR